MDSSGRNACGRHGLSTLLVSMNRLRVGEEYDISKGVEEALHDPDASPGLQIVCSGLEEREPVVGGSAGVEEPRKCGGMFLPLIAAVVDGGGWRRD
jgi:hypothetical protein